MAASPIFIGSIKNGQTTVVNADSTNNKTLVTAGSSGSKVETISVTSDDTSARVFQIIETISSVDYILGEVNVPAGAGTDGTTKAVDVLNLTDLPWLRTDGSNRYLFLASGSVLKVKAKVAVTTAKTVYFVAQYGDY